MHPSGEQHELIRGDQRAVVVEVGGGIRVYEVAGRDVLDSYPADAICDGAHGTPLIPWPNRLGDGRYSFDGATYQLALTEPERSNAIHGLLRWRPWGASEREPHRVVMTCALHPSPGYPFALEASVAYELRDDGLAVTIAARNAGEHPCPFGAGQHPYLSAGAGAVLDACTLELAAGSRIRTDPERMLPVGREAVPGGELDFAAPRPLGALQIDATVAELERDADGLADVRLSRPDGAVAELWADERFPYLEIFTGDSLAPGRRRRGLGVEPMTCPPNAFASGEDLLRLDPGDRFAASWGVRLR
ncbi:MAG TPA: aldose 1-epimerase family protein [Solirubrobacteraceae bacterium]|nr:aldose 1-epimerase family protein [Solirubrobacteraceae bacterium]